MIITRPRQTAAAACVLALSASLLFTARVDAADATAADSPAPSTSFQNFDRSRLPASLQDLPIERLSSGGLRRLDTNGDLVESPSAWRARLDAAEASDSKKRAAAVALDRRVGANIRLGDDPAALPPERRAQAEPHIARAPNNPDLLVATFQEGRYVDGGAVKCGYSVSLDGGLTWTRALIPGNYIRETDPVAGINLDGTIVLNTLGGRSTSGNSFDLADVVVSRSTDGGQTFTSSIVYRPPSSGPDPDKNWMAINTFPGTPSAGRILVTFTNFSGNDSPLVRVISNDGGVTWSDIRYVTPVNADCQGTQPLFLPDGRAAIVYWNFGPDSNPSGDDSMQVIISNDGGDTFGSPKFITNTAVYSPPGIRTGSFLPTATGDRTTANIYVAYQAVHQGSPRIMFTKSTNAGDTWSAPIPITDNPFGRAVFNPAIAASADGQTLTVVFYDMRDNPSSSTRVDMYLAQSFDGGNTWQPNIRLSSESTDASLAPQTPGGYMLGDYLGVAAPQAPNVPAVPVWVDTRTGNPDPFVTRVGIAPQVDFASWQAARLSLGQINDPQLGGEAGDADRDGEQNAVEFKYGTEPNDPNSIFRTGRQLNISTRARVLTGENILIGGFIVTGSDPKQVIIRALGPSLVGAGVPAPLQDPTLQLLTDNDVVVAQNDDWRETQQSEIEATGIPPSDDREAAIVQTLPPGNYTAAVSGKSNSTGVALVEVYDLTSGTNSRLANISTRSFVDVDEDVMIGGLIIGGGEGTDGAGSARVVLRGLGPSLAQGGVNGALQDPELLLVDGNGAIIQTNDNWRQTQQNEIQSLNLAPPDDREAALVASLARGNYTAIVRGREGSTGVALIEAYNVQ